MRHRRDRRDVAKRILAHDLRRVMQRQQGGDARDLRGQTTGLKRTEARGQGSRYEAVPYAQEQYL